MKRGTDRAVLTLLGIVMGAVAAIAAGQTWWKTSTHNFTGNDITDRLAQALALAIVAGVAVTMLLGVWGRRIAGALVAALGLGLMIASLTRHAPTSAQLEQTLGVSQVGGASTGAHWLAVLAGAVSILVGVGFVVRSAAWQSASRRFDRGEATRRTQVTDSLSAWKAMDAGHDPTEFDGNLSTTDPHSALQERL